ncbi:MAG: hypothetical protein A3J30_00440 [Candidatus Wildermuthbacteria bacterium RIFCSPLOWO2_02_FULL_47_9c]|uniref:Vitamin K epoxide reductase n=2 Tax=Parcubacteria group TaxID=1794811 RepID=A0A837INI0_9BACT|nr:MAG: Vitamin K epoxide reductase [Candidatus Yanofskybacteria bacterium GW2011_GWC1_48_11]KKW04528.1 MAG: Vitamin K epoxide reductase [Parcubacteria group bacterium GW2011_GWB1_49_12]KKW09214.1 MAG: Vitamin K epoxide reductase [Parcubacteria group bacterium GW2011_GWA1_49_26]KKW14148.1 MAG: Vitamin K epoxide reductase [Parcubacteria group bacterium GW2011_GWA2_50_10]OHA61466.1 MAG: hypothetical protein A2109_01130 [Candidatus Wildermuthbacteria bacterium GWA1_49_26]OHA66191.1 MAG: hypotheti
MEAPQNQQSRSAPKWWLGSTLALSFVGFLDASYLTAKHYLNFEIPCSILNGCEQVLTSQYATLFGVPVALLGALYYLAVFLLAVVYLDRGKEIFLKGAVFLPIAGFFATLWFLFVQGVLLRALCFYCLASALITTLLFCLSLFYLRRQRMH